MRRTLVFVFALGVASCGSPSRDAAPRQQGGARTGLGTAATAEQVAAWATDVSPDGAGLPRGSGTVAQGAQVYAQQCASCHGPNGEGVAPFPRLVGRDPREGFGFAEDPKLVRTIGNYWPYATTLYDYIDRAMPLTAPGSLTPDQVYAVTAYLLARNEIIPDTATLDSARLVNVRMPARERFVRDDRRGGKEFR